VTVDLHCSAIGARNPVIARGAVCRECTAGGYRVGLGMTKKAKSWYNVLCIVFRMSWAVPFCTGRTDGLLIKDGMIPATACMSEPGFSPGLWWGVLHPMLLFTPHCYDAKLNLHTTILHFFSYMSFGKWNRMEWNGIRSNFLPAQC